MEELDKYEDHTDKFESLFTLIVYDISIDTFIEKLYHQLNIIKLTKDKYKKKYLNDRLYDFIEMIKNMDNPPEKINCIYLIGAKIVNIPLNTKNINFLKEWNVKEFIFKRSERYEIDFIRDIFNTDQIENVIYVKNNLVTHTLITKYKKKLIFTSNSKDFNLEEYIEKNLSSPSIIYGISGMLKNFKSFKHQIILADLETKKLWPLITIRKVESNHKLLLEKLELIKNKKMSDRLIFKKEIKSGINNFMIKELFCSPEMLDRVTKKFAKDVLNFKIILIESLKPGDIGDMFKTDYKGILGYTYY
jgi:hypothetical protein